MALPARVDPDPTGEPGTTAGLGLLAVGSVGFALVYAVAVLTTTGQAWDNTLMERARPDSPERVRDLLTLVHLIGPRPSLLVAALVVLVTLVRRWRAGVAGALACLLCAAGSQLLKDALPRPELAQRWHLDNSLPSGHTAATACIALAVFFALARGTRRWAVLLGLLATSAMAALVTVLSYHRLSDGVASMMLATACLGVGLIVEGQLTRSKTAASP